MAITHPLDEVFGIDSSKELRDPEQGYSMIEGGGQGFGPLAAAEATPPAPDVKDADDIIVEERLDEVYTVAMETFNNQSSMIEAIEPRYAARTAEVAAQYLKIALDAASTRARVKVDRKRTNQFVPFSGQGKGTTNVIVASRDDILRAITVDGTAKEI